MARNAPTLLFLALVASATAPAAADQVSHTLPRDSILRTEDADRVVTDRDMLNKISFESQGSVDPSLEAYWASSDFDVYFSYDPAGYVKMDDWDDMDVKALWISYVNGAKNQSKELGYEVRPLRWIIEPTLDRADSVAHFAIEAKFGNDPPLVNMVVYDFGRHGYEKMTLVQNSGDFALDRAQTVARQMAGAYEFASGSQYADFRNGDKVAAIGAAGLVAAALGAKLGKGLLIVALLFLKKLWFLILAIPLAVWNFVRGRFSSTR